MWVSTVRSDRNSLAAICLLVRSSATSRAMSSCLRVSPVCGSVLDRRGRLRRRFAFHGERDAFVDRHRLAALEGHIECGLAQPLDRDGHLLLMLHVIQLQQG